MEKKSGNKEALTKMRPDPDFVYLAKRAAALRMEGQSLASDINRDPGEIPGFYAEEHRE